VHRFGSLAILDGQREIGQIAGREAAQLVATLAAEHGIGLVGLRNVNRYSRLSPYARLIADRGLVAIILNNAGPPAVAPYGAATPILGTNPIAFGFPSSGESYVIDMATSERVWGEIRQASLDGTDLPSSAFLDELGNETTNPARVESALPFGGPKGSALCIAIELIAGLVPGGQMGTAVADEYDLGAVFIAIRPADADNSASKVDQLLEEVRSASPRPGVSAVRAPGDQSRSNYHDRLRVGTLEIGLETVDILRRMAQGKPGIEADRLSN